VTRFPSPRRVRGSIIAALAAAATFSLMVPAAAYAEPVATIEQLSTFSPPSGFSSGGSAAVAYNPDSGVTLAAWAGTTPDRSVSAPVQISVIGLDGAPGATATYQPDNELLAGAGSNEPISVDPGANGGFLLTWNDGDSDNAVYGILAGSDGAFIGEAFTVSSNNDYRDTETVSAAWSPAAARYLVSWKTNVSTAFPAAVAGQQLVGRFIDETGAGIGDDFLVTDIPEQINDSQDVAFGGASWVVVGVDNSNHVLRAITVAADGTVGAPIEIPTPSNIGATGPSIAFNPELDQFLISAKDNNGDIWGQLLHADGSASGTSFMIVTGAQGKPSIASTGVNGWFLAWHVQGAVDVFGIALDSDAAVLGMPEVISSGAADRDVEQNFRPNVTFSGVTGQAYVIWSRLIQADSATNVVLRAWHIADGVPLVSDTPVVEPVEPVEPVVVPAVIADPELAATGVNALSLMGLTAASVLALLAGLLLVVRRRLTA